MEHDILIVDDDPLIRESLALTFQAHGLTAHSACDSQEAFALLEKHRIRIVLLDVSLGEENGLNVLERLLKYDSRLQVIMITGYASLEDAVKAIKSGAFDFLEKPMQFGKVLKVVENAARLVDLDEENRNYKNRVNELAPRIVTRSTTMLKLLEKARKLATTELPVLIYGESGTGKELLAQYIHNHSRRSSQHIVQINCAAIAENLLDNELFGHEKGAFTGADSRFAGVFEQADHGTLHLDEIGDMSLATQAKILRSLENREVKRIGSEQAFHVDIRLIASTNKNLEELVRQKQFREDLFFRLNAAHLGLIPLRERLEDLGPLVMEFLHQLSGSSLTPPPIMECAVQERLGSYSWPGNIRELRNAINYAAAVCTDGVIRLENLPTVLQEAVPIPQNLSLGDSERQLILTTLRKTRYNKKKTAEQLGISRKTLYNKLEKYQIRLDEV
jgi:DNA-binding NtrC family response regulator